MIDNLKQQSNKSKRGFGLNTGCYGLEESMDIDYQSVSSPVDIEKEQDNLKMEKEDEIKKYKSQIGQLQTQYDNLQKLNIVIN